MFSNERGHLETKDNFFFLKKKIRKKENSDSLKRKLSLKNSENKRSKNYPKEISLSNHLWIQKVCHLRCDIYNTNLLFIDVIGVGTLVCTKSLSE